MRDFVAHVRRHFPRGDAPVSRYDEVVDELASELEGRYAALRQAGASDEDAWAEVLAQVPSWDALARDLSAGARADGSTRLSRLLGFFAIDRWRRDAAFALRVLRKEHGFAATAIVTLAVCLGAHAAMTAAINTLVFHPLNVPEPDRVLLMANQYPRAEARRGLFSATPDYGDRLEHVTAFEEQALYNGTGATIEIAGVPSRVRGMVATPSLFRLLRVNPTYGRIFADDEGRPGSETRVILTDGMWREIFNADPAAVGRTLRLDGREFTIVGVLPREFRFGDPDARYWIPLALTEQQRSDRARHRNGWLSVGRLRPGATIDQVRDQLRAMDAVNLERVPPRLRSLLAGTGFYTGVEPLEDAMSRDVSGPAYLLWGATIVVLAIGIANLCTIALARSRARLAELGTRLALGAGRLDILRQLLVEGVLIAALGAAAALGVAAWLLSAVRGVQAGMSMLHVDAATAAITVALAALSGTSIGLVSGSPLLTMSLGSMLHETARGSTRGRAVRTTWRALVVAQMTCSFVLLVGCALLWVSIRNLMAVDPGFKSDNVISAVVSLSGPRYASDEAARRFVDRALASIRQLPGVEAAGATTIVPMSRSSQSTLVVANGYVPRPGEPPVSGVRSVVTPGYFEAVRTPLVQGRYLDTRDDEPSSKSIVIDERLARRFWPDGNAVGKRLFCPTDASQLSTIDWRTPWLTVIGVVRTARLNGPSFDESASGTSGTYYLPYPAVAPRSLGFVLRTGREWTGVVREVRSAVAAVDREIPLFDIRTLSDRLDIALSQRHNVMRLTLLFASVGVFLSALGLYGMLTYLVTQRAREIGVRLAVGGTPRSIVGLIVREGLSLALAGVAVGAAASLTFGRLLASHLYGVAPSDPWVMIAMTVTLSAVAACACVVPARRAAHVDVMRILS